MITAGNKINRQSGMALIAVLVMLTAVISLAANYVLAISRDGAAIDSLNSRIQARYSAYSGIQYGLFAMQERDQNLRWTTDGKLYSLALAGGQVYVSIVPAAGKIDINSASEELLKLLFIYLEMDDQTALELAANVIHWRGQTPDANANSVADDDYEKAGLSVPPHRRFYSIEEFATVYGISGAVYQRLKSLITVYGSNGRINAWSADDEVLRVLQLDDAQIEQIRTATEQSLSDATPVPGDVLGISPHLDFQTQSTYYKLQAYAKTANGQSEVVFAIIKNRRQKDGSMEEMQRGTVSGKARQEFIQAVEQAFSAE